MIRVFLTRTVDFPEAKARNVLNNISNVEGPLKFSLLKVMLEYNKNEFEWDEFFEHVSLLRKTERISKNDFIIVLTNLTNKNNWFSVVDGKGENNAFVCGNDLEWSNYIYSDPVFPIAYEVVANILQRFIFKSFEDINPSSVHLNPIGCLNDLCGWKPDITFKFRTADICGSCIKNLETCLPDRQIIPQALQIFETLRKEMLFSMEERKQIPMEENLPFNVSITKRKMSSTSDPFRKFLMLIDHFDSIVRTLVIMVLRLTKNDIEIHNHLAEYGLLERPTLGKWVECLKDLSNQGGYIELQLEIPESFQASLQEIVSIAERNEIVRIRNERRGHGYIDCNDSNYEALFLRLVGYINQIEFILYPFFRRFKYLYIINTSRKADSNWNISSLDLSGSNPNFMEGVEELTITEIDNIPLRHTVYLFCNETGKFYNLAPYYLFFKCPICSHDRLLIKDGKNYIDPLIGHLVSIQQ
jgi:hypothetical protein